LVQDILVWGTDDCRAIIRVGIIAHKVICFQLTHTPELIALLEILSQCIEYRRLRTSLAVTLVVLRHPVTVTALLCKETSILGRVALIQHGIDSLIYSIESLL
jgi:hypothetical protein